MENRENSNEVGTFKRFMQRVKRLPFKTGVIVFSICIPFYILSFAQTLFPISAAAKGVLWVVFFGLAKVFQYLGIAIIGVKGVKRIKSFIRVKKGEKALSDEEREE